MSGVLRKRFPPPGKALADPLPFHILASLPYAVLVVDAVPTIRFANPAAEQLLSSSFSHLRGARLDALIPRDSILFALTCKVLETRSPISQHEGVFDTFRSGPREATFHVAPLNDGSDWTSISVLEHALTQKIGRSLSHRGSARTVAAMAALMAHEVKNPLSGIRGAAQLLENAVTDEDRLLTTLIRDETDRIVKLVDRMELFSTPPPRHESVNIHQVLAYVRRLAETGFASGIRYVERYDPSLPPVWGDRDHLIQVFLNLVKNAAEACEDCTEGGGKIIVTTSYLHGAKMSFSSPGAMLDLPLQISIQDNGCGIPGDLQERLFDPFISGKTKGTGLGLAFVAKTIHDHGGLIEFESQPRHTVFRVLLPVFAPLAGQAPPPARPRKDDKKDKRIKA